MFLCPSTFFGVSIWDPLAHKTIWHPFGIQFFIRPILLNSFLVAKLTLEIDHKAYITHNASMNTTCKHFTSPLPLAAGHDV